MFILKPFLKRKFADFAMGPFTRAVFESKALFTSGQLEQLAALGDEEKFQLVRQVNWPPGKSFSNNVQTYERKQKMSSSYVESIDQT